MTTKLFAKTCRAAIAAICAVILISPVAAQTDGIFADFNTSMGSFTCRLDHALAPKAVANFVGLATGERAWLDLVSGQVKTNPFYNGQIFHRVIAGFMNQGGSPNGQGTDGPGYSFVDEFTPSLRHDSFGVLSMANSGPDSNGSQFFITAGATPWLDDVHTVFGRLVGGSNVVYAINHVATDSNNKPLTNVVLHSVNIRRVGAAAQAFDIHAQILPAVTNVPLSISKAATNVSLVFSNRLYADNRLYSSTNFAQWTGAKLGIETAPSFSNKVERIADAPVRFFRLAQVRYADALYVPRHVLGRTATLNFSGGNGTFVVSFNHSGGGTYTWSQGSPGTVAFYNWVQDPYRGRMLPLVLSGLSVVLDLHLDFDSATAGTFKGTAYPSYPSPVGSFPVSGTLAVSP